MRNLIKKILKESEFDNFDFVPEFEKNPAKDFLYKIMIELKISESKKEPGWMLYKDKKGEILMADDANIDQEDPGLFIDYDKIWLKLQEMGLNNQEIEKLLIDLLEVVFNRKVVTAEDVLFFFASDAGSNL